MTDHNIKNNKSDNDNNRKNKNNDINITHILNDNDNI